MSNVGKDSISAHRMMRQMLEEMWERWRSFCHSFDAFSCISASSVSCLPDLEEKEQAEPKNQPPTIVINNSILIGCSIIADGTRMENQLMLQPGLQMHGGSAHRNGDDQQGATGSSTLPPDPPQQHFQVLERHSTDIRHIIIGDYNSMVVEGAQ